MYFLCWFTATASDKSNSGNDRLTAPVQSISTIVNRNENQSPRKPYISNQQIPPTYHVQNLSPVAHRGRGINRGRGAPGTIAQGGRGVPVHNRLGRGGRVTSVGPGEAISSAPDTVSENVTVSNSCTALVLCVLMVDCTHLNNLRDLSHLFQTRSNARGGRIVVMRGSHTNTNSVAGSTSRGANVSSEVTF